MIKDIMVHLDGSPEDEIRLEHGQAIASAGRAHLIGIYTNLLPDLTVAMPMDGGGAAMQVLTELEERARKEGDATAQRLTERFASLQVPSELRRFDETFGTLNALITDQARCSDLVHCNAPTQPHRYRRAHLDRSRRGSSLRQRTGRLACPARASSPGPDRDCAGGWNGTREAARALRESMSFIEQATRTVVLVVDPEVDAEPWKDVVSHLARHGVNAEVAKADTERLRVADVILQEASRFLRGSDCNGRYGHARVGVRFRRRHGRHAHRIGETDPDGPLIQNGHARRVQGGAEAAFGTLVTSPPKCRALERVVATSMLRRKSWPAIR